MQHERLRTFLMNTKGRIFSVKFTKRSDGKLRKMRCRLGVRAYQKDPDALPDLALLSQDIKNDLVRVYDVDLARALPEDQRSRAYRSISLEGVQYVACGGEVFEPDIVEKEVE